MTESGIIVAVVAPLFAIVGSLIAIIRILGGKQKASNNIVDNHFTELSKSLTSIENHLCEIIRTLTRIENKIGNTEK